MADNTNQLRVRLVTPERTLIECGASAVELPSKSGYMEVLYGHAPLVAELGAGDVTIHGGPDGPDAITRYNVSWGFVEVLPDRVTILASDALKPEEIDVPRAEQQRERGREDVEGSRRKRRSLRRGPPCHLRSRSQDGLRRRSRKALIPARLSPLQSKGPARASGAFALIPLALHASRPLKFQPRLLPRPNPGCPILGASLFLRQGWDSTPNALP